VWGTTVDLKDRIGAWFMLGSTDLTAADATAARIIGQDVNQVDQLQRAYQQGVGQIRQDMIDLVGAGLNELRTEFRPADHTVGFGEVIIPGILLLGS
jgi:uncharacterized protein (DUF362 family)